MSILTVISYENPDEPVLTPDTVALARKVWTPALISLLGEKLYAPEESAVVDPSGVVDPSINMRTVAPASATPVISGVRSLVGVTATIDGVATMTGTGKIHDTTFEAGLSFPRISTAVT